jgi:GT2 family glycosyltransferase
VCAQSYDHWQFCICDDGSTAPHVRQLLEQSAKQDSRIRVAYSEKNEGISAASNRALSLAEGEFIGLLDHDDELAEDALFYVAESLNARPEADLIYSDEDKIDASGRRYEPFFKPDWSPDLLLSENYICHLLVMRRALVEQAGGFRREYDGSQDFDLVLRVTGLSDKIAHIPRVLYHWRSLASSTASAANQKSYAADAAGRAIQEALDRRPDEKAKVVPGAIPGRWRVRYFRGEDTPVSIIIASGGNSELLKQNLQALFAKTEYRKYEVVVIDNSKGTAIERIVQRWPNPSRSLRYLDWRNRPFNYSRINNQAARHCESPLLLFLNDDTTVIAAEWLRAMAEMAIRPEVGAVGAKLLYPDGRIQHAGVVMGLFENCGHAFKGLAGDGQHYFDFPDVIRNVSAVTGACLMTRAAVFREAGGFDEETFAVAFNDIDLCLKIGQKGYRVLYTPHALLYHHEAFSKTPEDIVPHPAEVAAMQQKWKDVIAADPYYSPNLTRTAEDYSFRRKA